MPENLMREEASAIVGARGRCRRMAWRLIGLAFFGLGLIGAVLPVLPTTGFWILALLALGKSDPALTERIRRWPGFGPAAAAFVDHGVISRRSKGVAIAGMSVSAALLALLAPFGWGVGLGLGGILIGAAFVLSRPEAPR